MPLLLWQDGYIGFSRNALLYFSHSFAKINLRIPFDNGQTSQEYPECPVPHHRVYCQGHCQQRLRLHCSEQPCRTLALEGRLAGQNSHWCCRHERDHGNASIDTCKPCHAIFCTLYFQKCPEVWTVNHLMGMLICLFYIPTCALFLK